MKKIWFFLALLLAATAAKSQSIKATSVVGVCPTTIAPQNHTINTLKSVIANHLPFIPDTRLCYFAPQQILDSYDSLHVRLLNGEALGLGLRGNEVYFVGFFYETHQ